MMRVKLMHTRDFSVGLALLALVIGLELGSQFMHGRTFFDAYNIARISRDFSFVGIAAIGAVMVIVSGGVDLSAGSVMGLSAVTFAALYTLQKWSAPLCLAGAISVGGLAGFVNGALIGYAGLPPFIATLGMMSIAAGLSYMFTQGLNISILWKEDLAQCEHSPANARRPFIYFHACALRGGCNYFVPHRLGTLCLRARFK